MKSVTSRPTLVAAVSIGIALGACARDAIRVAAPGSAHAQEGRQAKQYKVIEANADEYEENLNKWSAQGWRYSFSQTGFNSKRGSILVFEYP